MAEIKVSIPARPEFLHILRSVVASVAARLNFSYEGIDDLRIAVDEACAHLLGLNGGPASCLVLRISADDGAIEVLASADSRPPNWPSERATETLTWQVLAALADEAAFEHEGDHPAIRFMKRLPA